MAVTAAGRMVQSMASHGMTDREVKAIVCENVGSAESRMLAIAIRAEDAQALYWPSFRIREAIGRGEQPYQATLDAYWAALP
jgi:hypothetical protein